MKTTAAILDATQLTSTTHQQLHRHRCPLAALETPSYKSPNRNAFLVWFLCLILLKLETQCILRDLDIS